MLRSLIVIALSTAALAQPSVELESRRGWMHADPQAVEVQSRHGSQVLIAPGGVEMVSRRGNRLRFDNNGGLVVRHRRSDPIVQRVYVDGDTTVIETDRGTVIAPTPPLR